jgi:hypothetical protein
MVNPYWVEGIEPAGIIPNPIGPKEHNLNFAVKIPKLEKIAPVYAVITTMLYTWSFVFFLYRLPSWIYFSTIGEIGVHLAYEVVANFIESILVLLVPVMMSLVFPQKWFHDRFVSISTCMVLLGLGYMMYFDDTLLNEIFTPWLLLRKMLLVSIGVLLLTFLLNQIALIRSFLDGFANRVVIFLYILMPVTLVSLVTVLVRNIF